MPPNPAPRITTLFDSAIVLVPPHIDRPWRILQIECGGCKVQRSKLVPNPTRDLDPSHLLRTGVEPGTLNLERACFLKPRTALHDAAVGKNRCCCYVTRAVSRQERHNRGDLFRLGHAPHRDRAVELL